MTALGPRELLPPLQAIAPVLVFICLLTPPFHRGGPGVFTMFGIVLLTADGLRETLAMLLRFLGITLGFFAVVRTVSLDDLVLSLRWFGLPYTFCLVVIVALRTMPSLASTWHNVLDAHRLRSGPPATRQRKKIVETYLPVLTSLLIEAVKGIPVLAMALESRGFGRRNPRTVYAELKRGWPLCQGHGGVPSAHPRLHPALMDEVVGAGTHSFRCPTFRLYWCPEVLHE